MRTVDFVAMQMRRQPDDRIVPDLVYMQHSRTYTITLLKRFQGPQTAARVFGDGYLYEDARRFAAHHELYYPNDVIPWSLVLSLR